MLKIWDKNIGSLFDNNGCYSNDYFLDKNGKYKRCYFDKINGSWGKKKELFKSKKYYWYEFENIINEKDLYELFKDFGKNEFVSFKYIDRVGYFIYEVYSLLLMSEVIREDNSKGVYISYKNLEGILGKDFRKIIDRLCFIDLLVVVDGGINKNNYNYSMMRYNLNIDLLGNLLSNKFIENKVLDKFLGERNKLNFNNINKEELKYIKGLSLNISEDKLSKICDLKWENKKDRIRKELSWGKMFNKEDLSIKKELLLRTDGEKYKNLVRKRYKFFVDKLIDIRNGVIDNKLFYRDTKIYRSYNLINSMDKEFRKELRYKGNELVELDIKSCFVSCLSYLLERLRQFDRVDYLKESKSNVKDEFKYLRSLYSGEDRGEDNEKRIIKEKRRLKDIKKLLKFDFDYRFSLDSGEYCIRHYEDYYNDRYVLFSDYYNLDDWNEEDVKKVYDWGESDYNSLKDGFNKISKIRDIKIMNKKYYELFDEVNRIRDLQLVRDNLKNIDRYDININFKNFVRSDNLIFDVFKNDYKKEFLIDDKLEKSKVVNGKLYRGKDWEVDFSYFDYKLSRGNLIERKLKENVSDNKNISKHFKECWLENKVGDDYFIDKWDDIKYNYYKDIGKGLEFSLKKELDNKGEDMFNDFKDIIERNVSVFIKDKKNIINYRGWSEGNLLFEILFVDEDDSIRLIDDLVKYFNDNEELEYNIEDMLDIERYYWRNKKGYYYNYYTIKCFDYDEFRTKYIRSIKNRNRIRIEGLLGSGEEDKSKVGSLDYSNYIGNYRDRYVSGRLDFYSQLKFRFGRVVFDSSRLRDYNDKVKGNDSLLYRLLSEGKINVDDYLKGLNNVDIDVNDYLSNINEWGDSKVFDRDFYKLIVLRLLFSKINLSDGIGSKLFKNIGNYIFDDDVNMLIKKIKRNNLKVDVFGNKLNKVDVRENYKNLFKILGMIEVDIIDYLENNYLSTTNHFYCKIFDGIMIEKDRYFEKRFELNNVLKNEVGYMFEMR